MTLTRPRQWLLALALGALNILATSADTAERTAESNVADWQPVAEALGRPGTLLPGDIYRVGLPRTDLTVTVQGVQVKAGFALGSYTAFKKMSASAMVMGDLVLLDAEVSPVMSGLQERGLTVTALQTHGIQVTAIHQHALADNPRLFYMHFWANDDAVQLARGLRTALDLTKSPKEKPQ